jgi:hypothetical protein
MADDAEAQEIHATITSVGPREEPTDDDQMEPDVVGKYEDDEDDEDTEDHDTNPDAVIVGSATPMPASDDVDDDLDDLSGETSAEESPLDARADDDTHPDTVQAEAVPADVTDADVTDADVTDADVTDADVTDADVTDADVPDADAAAADAVPEDATLADVTAADAAPEDADAVPVDAVGPASADAFPRHARPADAIPEAARPGMPSDTTVVTSEGDLAGDPQQLHERWAAIQSTFVDDPRGSVEAAAELVTETINALTTAAKERETGLRGEWDREDADTEDLRNTLRNYRGLLDRLIAV